MSATPERLPAWWWEFMRCGSLHPRRKTPAQRRHIYAVRRQIFERSDGLCEMRTSPRCERFITWQSMHSAHIISAARGGAFEPSNLLAACVHCHIGWQHAGGKACPPKPKRVSL